VQGRPGGPNVYQAWLAGEPTLHRANIIAGKLVAWWLLAQHRSRSYELVEQRDRLYTLRVGQTTSAEQFQSHYQGKQTKRGVVMRLYCPTSLRWNRCSSEHAF
jgi:hypothetical protein